VLQAETLSLSGRVHHWLKSRSTREERKSVTRDNSNSIQLNSLIHVLDISYEQQLQPSAKTTVQKNAINRNDIKLKKQIQKKKKRKRHNQIYNNITPTQNEQQS
jgi:hypothetical protein